MDSSSPPSRSTLQIHQVDKLTGLSKTWFDSLKIEQLRTYLLAHGVQCSSGGKAYNKAKLSELSFKTWQMKLEVQQMDEENVEDIIKEKHRVDGKDLPLISSLENWSDCLDNVPNFSFADIYNYFIHKPGFDHDSLKSYKGLDGYKLMLDGHVRSVLFTSASECNYLKFRVQPTERKKTWNGKDAYDCWALMKNSGEIISAYCMCYGGADGGCRHVAAGLFEVDRVLMQFRGSGSQAVSSCTDKKCIWTRPAKKTEGATPVKQMRLDKQASTISPPIDRSMFDPRPQWAKTSSQKREIQLHSLIELQIPNAVALDVIGTNQIVSSISESHDSNCIKEIEIPTSKTFTIRDLVLESNADNSKDLQSLLINTKYSDQERQEITKSTTGQSKNPLWYEHRIARITGSCSYQVCHRREGTAPQNLINKIMGKQILNHNVIAPIEYGKKNEQEAIKSFIKMKKSSHRGLNVLETGLHVFPNCVFLGASPDGIVSCKCCNNQILEVKCIWKFRNLKPCDAAVKKGFVQIESDGKISLKKETPWFYQMQMEMLATNLESGILVIFTDLGIECILVPFDSQYADMIQAKINAFYIKYIIPHLIELYGK